MIDFALTLTGLLIVAASALAGCVIGSLARQLRRGPAQPRVSQLSACQ